MASTIFATRFAHQLATGVPPRQAMVAGFTLAYWVIAVIAFVGCAASILLLQRVEIGLEHVEAVELHGTSHFTINRAATSVLSLALLRGEETPEQTGTVPS